MEADAGFRRSGRNDAAHSDAPEAEKVRKFHLIYKVKQLKREKWQQFNY